MNGYAGSILRVDLSRKTSRKEPLSEEFARKWVGGRGFAVKLLWDELKPGIDPLGPENKFVVAVGPLAGVTVPNAGKTVVAAKSPLTGGYGDGNIGSHVTHHLRKAGYDAVVFEGAAQAPSYVLIEDDKVSFLPAGELWGKGSYECEEWLYERYGKTAGILLIGQGGENKNLYAVVRSMEGRAGGRPGLGAVMGSKNLKAIVVKGTKPIPVARPDVLRQRGIGDMRKVGDLDKKSGWSKTGTNAVLAWCNEMAALPVRNMRKTSHPDAWKIDGERLADATVKVYGCPACSMRCGLTMIDDEGRESELDYENVGMLGANLEIFDLKQVASLNYLCDDFGVDTISAGAVLAFYADAIDHGAAAGDFKFGDAQAAKRLLRMAALREGEVGDLLAGGSMRMARLFGKGSEAYAMHCKGLELSAYNCKYVPGQALSFGVGPMGAHHKEAWIITFELKETQRGSYGREKAQKVVDIQRIRTGIFEALPVCRFPWVEVGWEIKNYPDYLNAVTGWDYTLEDLYRTADRIWALMKAFYVREHPGFDRKGDYPPMVYFDPANADKDGIIAGKHLELDKYDQLLGHFYDIRGWDGRGVPTARTMRELGLEAEAAELAKVTAVT